MASVRVRVKLRVHCGVLDQRFKTSDEIHARVGFRVRLIEFADSLIMIAVVQY